MRIATPSVADGRGPQKSGRESPFHSLGLMNRIITALTALALLASQSSANETWRITTRGYGPIQAGQSLSQATHLMGTRLRTYENRPLDPDCDHLYAEKGYEGIGLMIQNGQITRVEVSSPTVSTLSGIRVGDSTTRLKRVFGSRLRIEQHKYDDAGFYYYVWEQGELYGVKFEIAGDKVIEIYAGDKSIQLVEGCA